MAKKRHEKLVASLYQEHFTGVQVPIMTLPKIMQAGLRMVEAGGNDSAIVEAMRQVIEKGQDNG